MGADEEGTHKRLVDPKIAEHSWRVVKNTGDGCWRNSRASSTRCAVPWNCSGQ
jgi:hypothetical protein